MRSNGGWKVNGSKNFITHAIACETLVAVAVTDKTKGNRGISAFVFDKTMDGFRSDKKENKVGMRASETASVVFEDCYVPEENMLGTEGEGFLQCMQVLDGGRISIAALAVGIAQGAYEAAVKEKPKTKSEQVEALLAKRSNGELGALIAAAACAKK